MTTRVQTSALDFTALRESLKTYLEGTDSFADYDFTGSALASLLDVLAHNTHFQALIANFTLNEAFLDSAQLRSSVVSHAKALNYFPRSKTAAAVSVDVTIAGATGSGTFILPKYTQFTTSVDEVSYTFYTLDEYETNVDSGYTFSDVMAYEGKLVTKRFIVDSGDDSVPIYVIPDSNLYSGSGSCQVRDGIDSTTVEAYTNASEISELNADSPVYFFSEAANGYYEIMFGISPVGKSPAVGSVIEYTYLSTKGPEANGARDFATSAQVSGLSMSVVANGISYGGSDRESLASIKANAPRAYAAQGRAVTESDYIALITSAAGYIETISVWGGQKAVPPQYGRMFIAIKPTGRDAISEAERAQLTEITLKDKSMAIPVFVDPVFQYLEIRASVRYDSTKTILTAQQIESRIKNRIIEFGGSVLNGFGSVFRRSNLLTSIDKETSIVDSNLEVLVQRRLKPVIGSAGRYDVPFTVSLAAVSSRPRVVESEAFQYTIDGVTFNCNLRNKTGSNTLEIYRSTGSGEVIVVDDAGYIDTATNSLVISPFEPSGITNTESGIRISAYPADGNRITTDLNILIRLDEERIFVTAEQDE